MFCSISLSLSLSPSISHTSPTGLFSAGIELYSHVMNVEHLLHSSITRPFPTHTPCEDLSSCLDSD